MVLSLDGRFIRVPLRWLLGGPARCAVWSKHKQGFDGAQDAPSAGGVICRCLVRCELWMSWMIKVAFSGAHGTGKTSLLTHVADLLGDSGVRICKEVPREIIGTVGDPTFFRLGQNTPLRQMLVLLQQVVDEQTRTM